MTEPATKGLAERPAVAPCRSSPMVIQSKRSLGSGWSRRETHGDSGSRRSLRQNTVLIGNQISLITTHLSDIKPWNPRH